jgi:hypothetical protein
VIFASPSADTPLSPRTRRTITRSPMSRGRLRWVASCQFSATGRIGCTGSAATALGSESCHPRRALVPSITRGSA